MSPYSVDVEADDFQQVVIEGSREVPVVVDFWAPWCGPCRVLKPLLEKLAQEYQGKFLLAKVDSDRNQEIATQFGVRGIPSVKAFVDGEQVDEFSGALPESGVRAFLERLLPSPVDTLRIAAGRARDQGDSAQALQLLAQASELDGRNEDLRLDAADILLEQGQVEEARHLFDSLSPAMRMEARAQQIAARLDFAQAGGGDEAGLRAAIEARPDDMDSRLQLAKLLIASDRQREGLTQLLEMVLLDRAWQEGLARKTMLAVFTLRGSQDPLVAEYRRRLASALN